MENICPLAFSVLDICCLFDMLSFKFFHMNYEFCLTYAFPSRIWFKVESSIVLCAIFIFHPVHNFHISKLIFYCHNIQTLLMSARFNHLYFKTKFLKRSPHLTKWFCAFFNETVTSASPLCKIKWVTFISWCF